MFVYECMEKKLLCGNIDLTICTALCVKSLQGLNNNKIKDYERGIVKRIIQSKEHCETFKRCAVAICYFSLNWMLNFFVLWCKLRAVASQAIKDTVDIAI